MKTRRTILLTGAVVIVLGAGLGVGSFATFNAQVNNPNNVFGHGTLVLSNTKQGGVACLSTGGGSTDVNVNTSCDQLFNLSVRKPGDAATANLTLRNVGTINASALKVFSPACTNANSVGETYNGTGNPCSVLQLYLQQWSDAAYSTPLTCLYGGATGNTCNFSDTTKTLSAFTSAYSTPSGGLGIGSGLSAGSSAYVTIGIQSPSSANNSYQGRQASLDFGWYIEQ